jgi:hypothetical protein
VGLDRGTSSSARCPRCPGAALAAGFTEVERFEEYGAEQWFGVRSPSAIRQGAEVATVEDVRGLGSSLERSYPVYVRGRLKFRVKQIVYVAFSLDETEMGFGFPKEERAALVAAQPDRFHLPRPSDLRFNWVEADLAALDPAEAREFVVEAWRMVVPKKISRAYDLTHPDGPG